MRPGAQLIVHQCAQFIADTKQPHNQAVKHVLYYLKGTAIQWWIINPDPEKGIKYYIDSDFAGGWNQEEGKEPGSFLSIMGYRIIYANWPIIWVIQIHKEIALSTAEVEYIAIGQATRDILPFVSLMKEF